MKAMPRTRVSLNSKAHQLGWLKTQKNLRIPVTIRLLSLVIVFINTIHCVLKTAYAFLSVFKLTYLLLALFKFFSSELVSGYHGRLIIKFCC